MQWKPIKMQHQDIYRDNNYGFKVWGLHEWFVWTNSNSLLSEWTCTQRLSSSPSSPHPRWRKRLPSRPSWTAGGRRHQHKNRTSQQRPSVSNGRNRASYSLNHGIDFGVFLFSSHNVVSFLLAAAIWNKHTQNHFNALRSATFYHNDNSGVIHGCAWLGSAKCP